MDENIKLPGSSFDEVAKIIQGYAAANKAVSLDDVSKRVGMHTTIVSRNNGFLLSIGVLEGGRNKTITPLGKMLGDALSHGLELEVRSLLQQIVDSNEFLKNLVGAVRIRKGMDESALRAHVAYSAGQSKSQGVMTGTGTVVELLKRAGVIEERDGKLQAVSNPVAAPAAPIEAGLEPALPPSSGASRVIARSLANGAINLTIEVRINCAPDQLNGLGTQLRAVIDEFEAATAPRRRSDDHSND